MDNIYELMTIKSNEELKQEIERLSNDLTKCQKYIQLLEKYRKYLINISNNCKCNQNINQKIIINLLENEYKTFSDNYNNNENVIEIKDEVLDQNISIDENEDKSEENIIELQINSSINQTIPSKSFNTNNNSYNESENENSDQNITVFENNCNESVIKIKEEVIDEKLVSVKNEDNYNDCNKTFAYPLTGTELNYVMNCYKTNNDLITGLNCNPNEMPPFKCDFIGCNFETNNKYYINKHKERVHKTRNQLIHKTYETKSQAKGKPLKCDFIGCDYESKYRKFLKIHKERDHKIERELKCGKCRYRTRSKEHFNDHKNRMHNKNLKKFKCNVRGCNRELQTKVSLNRHKRLAHKQRVKQNLCDWPGCQFTSNNTILLERHKVKHTKTMSYACDYFMCKSKFYLQYDLENHILSSHIKGAPVRCDWPECDFKTWNESIMDSHRCKHTGEQPYMCSWPECGRRFSDKHEIIKHKRKHRGDRLYTCTWGECERKFINNRQMEVHIKNDHKSENLVQLDSSVDEIEIISAESQSVADNEMHLVSEIVDTKPRLDWLSAFENV